MLFNEIVYTRNQRTLKATDYLLSRAWEMLCEKHTKKITPCAIRALMIISDNTEVRTTSLIANQLCDLFDAFSDERSLCVRGNDFHSFSLTFEGEVMKGKIIREITKKYEEELIKMKSNKHMHSLEI